jgi:aminoglycoside phosphotransferase (APT) family kinase protein
MPRMPAVESAPLAATCTRHLGHEVEIRGLRRLSGGASRETWSFDAVASDGSVDELILRRDPGATIGGTDRGTEYELLRAAHAHGVTVPEVRFLLTDADDLGSGFVMARIEGETIPRKILRDPEYAPARAAMTRQCAEAAAAIHAIPVDELPTLPRQDAPTLVEQYRGVMDMLGEPHPTFELALVWLAERADPLTDGGYRLVHGDLRNGNFVVGPEGMRAVLDWELAHLGDPIEDLGWFCVKSWRFGNVDRRAGGFGTAAELLDADAAAGGAPVDEEALRYWEVFGTLKWGVICQMQTFSHLNRLVRSVELAALGRRVAENEWDLLALLDRDGVTEAEEQLGTVRAEPEAGPRSGVAPAGQPIRRPATKSHERESRADGPPSSHDRPTVGELVEAVREYLERDVMAVEGRVGFHARVASRVLAMVERELALGAAQCEAAVARLGDLLGTTGDARTLETELAARIRSRTLTADPARVLAVVRSSVRDKLLVANPDYLDR